MARAYPATRRAVVAALVGLAGARAADQVRSASTDPEAGDPDHAVQIWRAWQEARAEQRRLCAQRDQIEATLIKAIGYPRVLVTDTDGEMQVERYAVDGGTIDALLGRTAETQDLRRRLKADLRRQKIRWAAWARTSGLRQALACERAADRKLDELTDAMASVQARTLEGVMSKLFVAIEMGEAGPDERDMLPWLHLRSALADLVELTGGNRVG